MLKEFAKFLTGVTTWELFAHIYYGASGILPITILGITVTTILNTISIIVYSLLTILLAYYAWFRKFDSVTKVT